MEGVAAFSLICNVIQVVELSRKIITTAKEIQSSRSGAIDDHEELQVAATYLQRTVDDLRHKSTDDVLQQLASRSQAAISRHMALLESLRGKGQIGSLQATFMALKARWKQRQLEESQAHVDRLSKDLTTHVILTCIPSLNRDMGHLGADIANHHQRMDEDIGVLKKQLARVGTTLGETSRTGDTTQDLVRQLHQWITEKEEIQIQRQCLHALYFPQLRSREEEVKPAHKKTFGWIFDDPSDDIEAIQKSKFRRWLQSDDSTKNLFWISGKPGAGKSTLMKFIAHHPSLKAECRRWADSKSLIIVDYYFWRHGSPMQRSLRGLLQSLLYQVLRQQPQLVTEVFPDTEWITGGPQFQFPYHSLLSALNRLVTIAPRHDLRFLFLVDGLDEFDDRPSLDSAGLPDVRSLIILLRIINSSASAKMCVASRPLNEFESAFGRQPDQCFQIHDLTRQDIASFVDSTLKKDVSFLVLAEKDTAYETLVAEIIRAAEGVFLWVFLACNSLLDGLTNEHRILDLRRRLQRLPRELGDMYTYILSTIEPEYRRNSARSLISSSFDSVFLWHVYLDDDERINAQNPPDMKTEAGIQELFSISKRLRKRFAARTRCLLEVREYCQETALPEYASFEKELVSLCDCTVVPTHRTVAEFIREPKVLERLTKEAAPFDSEIYLSAVLSELTFTMPLLSTLRELHAHSEDQSRVNSQSYEREKMRWLRVWNYVEMRPEAKLGPVLEKMDKLLRGGSPHHASGLHEIIQLAPSHPCQDAFPPTSWNCTIFEVAVANRAPRAISHLLSQDPTLAFGLAPQLPPLLIVLHGPCDNPDAQAVARVLLERGANPNLRYGGTTPWKSYLSHFIAELTLEKDVGLGKLTMTLIKHGADLEGTCEWNGFSYISFGKFYTSRERLKSMFVREVTPISFRLSVGSIIRYIMDEYGSPEDREAWLSSYQPSALSTDEEALNIIRLRGQEVGVELAKEA